MFAWWNPQPSACGTLRINSRRSNECCKSRCSKIDEFVDLEDYGGKDRAGLDQLGYAFERKDFTVPYYVI